MVLYSVVMRFGDQAQMPGIWLCYTRAERERERERERVRITCEIKELHAGC